MERDYRQNIKTLFFLLFFFRQTINSVKHLIDSMRWLGFQ